MSLSARRRLRRAVPAAVLTTLPLLAAGCTGTPGVCAGSEPGAQLGSFAG